MSLASTNDSPRSHIQLIVPEHYLLGGALASGGAPIPFDGDVDTIESLGVLDGIAWDFVTAIAKPSFSLLYGHQGTGGELQIVHDSADVAASASVDTGGSWTVSATSVITRNISGGTAFQSLLVEHSSLSDSRVPALQVNTGGDSLRLVMFSKDYAVPMHDKSWACSRSFVSRESESYLKQKFSRFMFRNTVREVAEHSFEWTGLTDTEVRNFDLFFAAFGGNIVQPFAMCTIYGGVLEGTMDCRILIIESQTIDWTRSKGMQRNGLKFSAIELIPN